MIGRRPCVRQASAAALALALVTPALAEPRLVVTHEPPPRNLRMRRTASVQPPTPASPAPTSATTPASTAPARTTPARSAPPLEQTTALRDLTQRVSFSIDVGYQLDSANPTGRASLGARAPVVGEDYAKFRAYGFGEVYGATRGIGLASLSSYFAVRFQAARRLEFAVSPGRNVDVAPPIATWFERSGADLRSVWGELRDFLPRRWGLAKVRLRAGSQYVYGPWITHLDGGLVSYDGRVVTATAYGGQRHSDYTRDLTDKQPSVVGGSLRFDLRGLPSPIPLAITGEALKMGPTSPNASAHQPASESAILQGDWRPRRDVAVIAQVRTLDRKSASQRLELRARYKQVSNIVLDLTHHTEDDWRWDPSLTVPDADPTAAKRYLDLGPVVPQLTGSARAGTLIAENVDLLVRGAFASEGKSAAGVRTSFTAPYVEFGGALEVRLRRTVALGASLLTRQTNHPKPMLPIVDQRDVTQPLAADENRGDEGFTEAGGSAKMTLGARRFSSLIEIYGRRTRYAVLYADPTLEIPTSDVRIGGRFTLDAWVGQRARLLITYDVSSALAFAPEITAYRSLRLMISGVY